MTATLEMESYLPSKMMTLGTAATDVEHPTEKPTVTAAAVTSVGPESTSGLMKQLLERMDRMEVELRQSRQIQAPHRRMDPNNQPRVKPQIICWNCNRPGHIARNCRLHPSQGNANPYTE